MICRTQVCRTNTDTVRRSQHVQRSRPAAVSIRSCPDETSGALAHIQLDASECLLLRYIYIIYTWKMSSPPLVIVDPHFHMWTAARPNANLGDILAKVPLYDAAAYGREASAAGLSLHGAVHVETIVGQCAAGPALAALDVALAALFSAEYATRLACAPSARAFAGSFFGLVDAAERSGQGLGGTPC